MRSSKWKKVKLKDVIQFNPTEKIKKGSIGKKIGMDKLHPFQRKVEGFEHTSFTGGSKFRNGDTLMARITPCLENGKTAQVNILDNDEVGFGSTEFIVMREKVGYSINDFIYYLAISPKLRDIAIKSMTGTSGRQRAQVNVIENTMIRIPSVTRQKVIAQLLSYLDDKIELNTRINQNLEAMAQAIFKHWFVDFEFPNENGEPYKSSGGEMVESELGLIPRGWRVKSVPEVANILSGGTPKTKVEEYWNGKIDFFTPKDATNGVYAINTEKKLTKQGLEKCNSKFFPERTIFITARGTVGKLNITGKKMAMNQSCYAIQHQQSKQYYLYLVLKQLLGKIINSSNGAVFNAVNVRDFRIFKFVDAPNALVDLFEKKVSDLFKMNYVLTRQNENIINLRDTLLPKLMSGEIRVPVEKP